MVAIAEAARKLVLFRDRWLNPEGVTEAELKKRTLTNLYNQRPSWLNNARKALDKAVLEAYGWPHNLTDDEAQSGCSPSTSSALPPRARPHPPPLTTTIPSSLSDPRTNPRNGTAWVRLCRLYVWHRHAETTSGLPSGRPLV